MTSLLLLLVALILGLVLGLTVILILTRVVCWGRRKELLQEWLHGEGGDISFSKESHNLVNWESEGGLWPMGSEDLEPEFPQPDTLRH